MQSTLAVFEEKGVCLRAAWCLTLFLGSVTLPAQVREETYEVPLSATYHEVVLLRPGSAELERPIAIDPANSVFLTFASNSATVEVTLIEPGGIQHPGGATDSVVVASRRIPSPQPDKPASRWEFELRDPPGGMWRVLVREPATFTGVRAVLVNMISSSEIAARLLGAGREFSAGTTIHLGLILAGRESGIPGSALSSLSATASLDGSLTPITFVDDGTGEDEASGDGVYSATFTVAKPGRYSVNAIATGTYEGFPFARSVSGSFLAVTRCASLQRMVRSEPRDEDRNGRPESLDLVFAADVSRAAKVRLSAILTASNGNEESGTAVFDLAAGARTLTVPVSLDHLRALGVNGPYRVTEARLECFEGDDIHTNSELFDLGPTVAFDLDLADRDPIEKSGLNSERRLDTNGNGQFDRLEFGVGLDLLNSGNFSWSAVLTDDNGTAIDLAAGSGALAKGRVEAKLTFDGTKIGRNAVNGPYHLTNFVISGGSISTVIDTPGETQAYGYDSFEGAPATAPVPSGISVRIISVTPSTVAPAAQFVVRTSILNPNLLTGLLRRRILLSSTENSSVPSSGIAQPPTLELGGRAEWNLSHTISLPEDLPPGRYMVAEEVTLESSGENVSSNAMPLTIIPAGGAFDVSVEIISVQPSRIGPGVRFDVSVRLRSQPAFNGAYRLNIVLSSDSSITSSDRRLFRDSSTWNGTTRNVLYELPLPNNVTPGEYWIGVILEHEGDSNPANDIASSPVTVIP